VCLWLTHSQVHDENKDTVYLMITGKHEEKADEHGFVSRHFTRRYALPKDVDVKELHCDLSNKGLSACVLFASHHSTSRHSHAAGAAQAPHADGQQHTRYPDHACYQRPHARRDEAVREKECRVERPLRCTPPSSLF
jgi:hypothetical protein